MGREIKSQIWSTLSHPPITQPLPGFQVPISQYQAHLTCDSPGFNPHCQNWKWGEGRRGGWATGTRNTDTASPFTSTPSPAGQWVSHSDSTGPTKPEFSRTERGHRMEGSRLHYVLGFAWDFPGVKILCRLYKTHLESLDETCIRMHTHIKRDRRKGERAQKLRSCVKVEVDVLRFLWT